MANICIICSSPGDYDIFAAIPAYLHASPNEFLLWPKHVSKMLEETTGLIITEDDVLLPRKICALCISYLKHAATFRQQAIDNILNLKTAQLLKNPDKHSIVNDNNSISIKEDQLNFSQSRCSDLKNLLASKPKTNKCDVYFKKNFDKSPMPNSNLSNNDGHEITVNDSNNLNNSSNNHLNTYLNLLFDKDTNKTANNRRKYYYQMNRHKTVNELTEEVNPIDLEFEDILTGSSDENDITDHKKTNFFSYKEKNFEEDDILNDILKDANIIINIPEIHKERKCPACCKRFMFEDSYEEHTSICIEYQLLCLIEEINRLLIVRRKKTISPHEFVRRMIFSLKKIADWLRTNGENINIPSQSDVKKTNCKKTVSKESKKKENDSDATAIVEHFNSLNSTVIENPKFNSTTTIIKDMKNENSTKKDIILHNSNYVNKIKTSTPETKQNNSRKLPENTFQTIQQNAEKKAAKSGFLKKLNAALCTPSPPSDQQPNKDNNSDKNNKSGNFNTVLLTPVGHLTSAANYTASPSPKPLNFSARCSVCSVIFETIAALEDHNAKFHNYQPVEKEEHKKIIALFEDE